jgi:hypothetical protein
MTSRAHSQDAALLAYALGDTCSLLWAIDRRARSSAGSCGSRLTCRLRDAHQPGAGDTALGRGAGICKTLINRRGRVWRKKTLIIV